MVRIAGLVLAAGLLGCSGGSSTSTSATDTESGGTSSTSSSGAAATTTQPPDMCESTEDDCAEEGLFCVAPYDAGGGGKGVAACVPECVAERDIQRWCIDDDACCEGLLCREVDGYCEPPDLPGTGSGSSTGTGTGTSTGTSG